MEAARRDDGFYTFYELSIDRIIWGAGTDFHLYRRVLRDRLDVARSVQAGVRAIGYAQFDWPGHTEADLFAVDKVLNEMEFGPLMDLHDVMIALKIGRHYRGEFKLSKAGQTLVGHPGQIFGIVTLSYLVEANYARFSRFDDEPILRELGRLAERAERGGRERHHRG